jgi:hypothetical protein
MPALENDHNVYILGAGFSQDAGYPLTNGFLNRMRDAQGWLEQQPVSDGNNEIREVLEYRLEAAAAAYWTPLDLENIEELFSLASADENFIKGRLVAKAIAATLRYVEETRQQMSGAVHITGHPSLPPLKWVPGSEKQEYSVQVHQEITKPQAMDAYTHYLAMLLGMYGTGAMKGRNTIITFNYDCLVDQALSSLGVPWTYGFHSYGPIANYSKGATALGMTTGLEANPPKESDSVGLYKIHGSVNWGRKADEDGRLGMTTIYGSYSDLRASNDDVVLVPPSWQKTLTGPVSLAWTQAVQALSKATRIVVIGFSMPPTDTHFRYLLAAGLKANASLRSVLFVDPAMEAVRNRALQIFNKVYVERELIRFTNQRARDFCMHSRWPDSMGDQTMLTDTPLEWIGRAYPKGCSINWYPKDNTAAELAKKLNG